MSEYISKAQAYIEGVLAGRIITNRWVKLACQRQLDDLAKQGLADWPYSFDEEAATDVCSFLEILTHVKGKLGGKQFVLEPFQCFIVTTLFGWKRKDDTRLRRFRRSYLSMGKSNGKSFISSGIAIYMLAGEAEPGAEVLCVARAKDQAKVVFDTTREMLRANPKLCQMFDIQPLQEVITHGTSCTMRPATNQGKSLAGTIPHLIIADETWAWPKVELLEECERAVDKRDNSLFSTITHAAADLGSVGYQQHETACAILTGELKDERTFCCMWSAEGYPWTSDEALKAANPCLGVSVYEDTLREARDRAVKVPALQVAFRAKNLCEWIGGDITWLDPLKLVDCREKGLRMETFRYWHVGEHTSVQEPDMRRPFVLGLDLASRQDIAAVVFVCTGLVAGVEHFYAFGRYYLPENTIANSPIAAYRGRAARNLITSMPGFSNDYDKIQEDILGQYHRHHGYSMEVNPDGYSFVLCAFDDWQANQLSGNLQKAGINSVVFAKTSKNYSPVMDWLTSLVLEGRFHFSASDDVMMWALSNVVCHRDRNENLFPNKVSQDRKIDPAIALLYALRAAMVQGGDLLRVPKNSDAPRVTFIHEDDSAVQVQGNTVTVLPPLPELPSSIVRGH